MNTRIGMNKREPSLGKSIFILCLQNLTYYMKEALGGNCETVMLCCISSMETSLRDTLSTLKYGNLARHIKNKPIVNEVHFYNVKVLFAFYLYDI